MINNVCKYIIGIILFVSCPTIIKAQYNDSLRYHFIIAFDKAGCRWNVDNSTIKAIDTILFSSRKDLADRTQLFQDGDYVSFVGFAIDARLARDMDVFALPMKSQGEKKIFQSYTKSQLKRFMRSLEWGEMIGEPIPGDKKFSLVSVAKPYSLMALRSNHNVNRTFIITITDHSYNGKDFYDELNAFEQFARHRRSLAAKTICKKAYQVDQYYYTKFCETRIIGNRQYAELYEFAPLQQHFSLSYVMDYPKQIHASMRRGEKYVINFDIKEGSNPLFKVEHLEMFLDTNSQKTYVSPEKAKDITAKLAGGNISMGFNKNQNIQALKLRAWVRMTDGIYDNTILSPSKYSPVECGREGLNVTIPIIFEQPLLIYGFIPLFTITWLPFFKTQYAAVMFWQIAIPILIIFIIWLSVFYVRPYTPKKGDFKLVAK